MKLSDLSIDPVRFEQGEWIGEQYGTPIPEMGDLCVLVRGLGNADWRRMQQQLMAAVPRGKKTGGVIDTEEVDRINSTLLLKTSLKDWSGIEDASGNPVPYSEAQAQEILTNPEHRRVRDAIFWAASIVGEARAKKVEQLAKN